MQKGNNNGTIISFDFNKFLSFNEQTNRLTIKGAQDGKGLTEGTYWLTLNEYQTFIKIMIVKGSYWNNTQMILTEDELIDFKNRINTLIINGISYSEPKEGKCDINVKLMTMDPKRTRLHLFAFNYMPSDIKFL